MSKRILARLGLLIVVLFGVTVLTFFYTNLSPVDAAEALAVRRYNRPTAQQVELVREELGLDQPILQQYGSWLWKALHLDFGISFATQRPVLEDVLNFLPATLQLAGAALVLAALGLLLLFFAVWFFIRCVVGFVNLILRKGREWCYDHGEVDT